MIGFRRPELERWLADRFPGARISTLAGDASSRRFHRLTLPGGSTRVLMDYGEPFDGETDDVRLARLFWQAGLPAAAILEQTGAAGCLVLEDLGDRSLESALANRPSGPDDPIPPLLDEAVRLAARVARDGTPLLAASDRADGPALDAGRFRFEMEFFLEHFVAGFRGSPRKVGALRPPLLALADRAAETPRRVLCHRDFHSRNLMVRRDGTLAMVDLQDARWGPDSYDLASILRDAYAEIPETWVAALIARYIEEAGVVDPSRFRQRLTTVSIQRMIKALGSFGYLTRHLQTDRYRPSIPPTLARLDRMLRQGADEHSVPLRRALTQAGLLRG